MIKTIKGKIIGGLVLTSLVVHVITNAMIWKVFEDNLEKYIINDIDKIKSIAFKEIYEQYTSDFTESNGDIKESLLPILNTMNKRYDSYISIDWDEKNNIAFTGRELNNNYKGDILIESGKKAVILYTVLDKQVFFATYAYPIYIEKNYKGTLVLQKNYTKDYTEYKKIMNQILVVEGILYIIMLLVLLIWLTKTTKSLKYLARGMELVGEGNYTGELELKGNDEVANLTKHFNRMQHKIINQMEQLSIEKNRIELLEKNTNNFFNYATHEMKTPVTALKGYGELLEEGEIDEETQKKIYQRIRIEADRIHKLVQNMLIVASGKEKINPKYESFNIKTLILEMIEELEFILNREQVKIEIDIKDAYIYAIKEEIRIAFKNLIENGIKHSSDKNIYIKSYNENPFKITVCNKCRPMPEKLKNHLLEPFIKYNYEDLQLVSSGLGLFICKELLSKNNAEITYSIVEDNICFSIEFINDMFDMKELIISSLYLF